MYFQARTIKGIFMSGSAARKVTETESSLPALQELPRHQEPVGNQVKTTKKPSRWSGFGTCRVETKKTHGFDYMGHTAGFDVQYEPTKNEFANEPEGLR